MSWPKVLPGDDGIRPAGPADACLYCKQKIGQEHKRDCVVITQVIQYDVTIDDDPEVVGIYIRAEAHHRSLATCEDCINNGSWCVQNAFDEIVWAKTPAGRLAQAACERGDYGCGCGILNFVHAKVIESGPIQQPPRDSGRRNRGEST